MKSLVQRLISARKAAGISQAIAAEHLNISRPTFIAIEKGTREVKPEELKALAFLYNTSINRLMRHHAPPTQVAPHLRAVVEREGEDAGLESAVAKLVEFVDDYMFLLDKVQGHAMPTPPPQPVRTSLPVERFAEIKPANNVIVLASVIGNPSVRCARRWTRSVFTYLLMGWILG